MPKRALSSAVASGTERKQVTLSIKDKVNLIKKLESGTAVAKLCEEYGLGRFFIIKLLKLLFLNDSSQIAILVCSNLAPQSCKLATNLTQECKLEASLKQVSHHKSKLSKACCVKLIANYSKNRAQTQPRIRFFERTLPKHVALTIQPARLHEEKIVLHKNLTVGVRCKQSNT
ncbi:hypothetical protein AVEN_230605-1 [Araneus ventricosus]|uniref:HTH psq-type domain-containing protein n=1 Tax=Araneus ventricosus TaxID=182803 RepID=A0A4Y2NWX6_ARAVE|nr:hypothetical protein AVEN_230605-1 [Araneus ventricosus]